MGGENRKGRRRVGRKNHIYKIVSWKTITINKENAVLTSSNFNISKIIKNVLESSNGTETKRPQYLMSK